MAELGRVPGQLLANSSEVRERGQERGRRGRAAAAVVLEPVSQPLLCPLSPSPHWLLRGHTPWPGPRNQGVRTRVRGEEGGNKTARETERDKATASVQKMTGCLILQRNFERLRSRRIDVARKGRLIRNNRRKQSVKVALLLFPL